MWIIFGYPHGMKHPNGIEILRRRKDMTKAELARRVGTTPQQMGRLIRGERKVSADWAARIAKVLGARPEEVMFHELTSVDVERFQNVFQLGEGASTGASPMLALDPGFLRIMAPRIASHQILLLTVDTRELTGIIEQGDMILVDVDDRSPLRSGIYVLDIGGIPTPRHIAITTSGQVSVTTRGNEPHTETVQASALQVIGRAVLRISTI